MPDIFIPFFPGACLAHNIIDLLNSTPAVVAGLQVYNTQIGPIVNFLNERSYSFPLKSVLDIC